MIDATFRERFKRLRAHVAQHNDRPELIPKEDREMFALMFAGLFLSFRDFAELGMAYLGFKMSEIQDDIADFMQHGYKYRMVQAQRGQAKSTLAALYCIWRLIQRPKDRCLIVSAGGDQADSIALIITRIINQWDILCWMRPDTTRGDRDSAKNYDIHCDLKGIDKSASVSSVGISAQLAGKRADFLLADDIEVMRNSMTQTEREKLALQTREFSAICIHGDIMYLGTPQTKDSIYRELPRRGFSVRVWTGRYPTNEELERYGSGTEIAPMIMKRLLENPELQTGGGIEGNRGQPTDPNHIGEDTLQSKELDYGPEGFALQYMLDTTLSDEMRTKIKLSDIPVVGTGTDSAPEVVQYKCDPTTAYKELTPAMTAFRMYWGIGSDKSVPFEHKVMIIDPAGSGGDEIAFATGAATNSYIYLLSVGGFKGGTKEENLNKVIMKMVTSGIKDLDIERNMGHGTVTQLVVAQIEKLRLKASKGSQDEDFLELLQSYGVTHSELTSALSGVAVNDYFVTTQKERRIIDTISPVTRRHKLVVTSSAIQEDWEYCLQHPMEKRNQYSCFYQLGNITYDRGSLVHDDRADCVQRLVERLSPFLAKDDEAGAVKRREEEIAEWRRNPMGYTHGKFANTGMRRGSGTTKKFGGRRR
ncbi:DNA maturase B [Acinetobacter phage MRABP9]|uniref:DNA maturase B n=1 Tax=Acinetobacter phage MRABP9 TaxID=2996150 RepID=A0A9E9C1H0_9CAUD|nr:DNA maturase B [Acinetobacter phage MRABP9]